MSSPQWLVLAGLLVVAGPFPGGGSHGGARADAVVADAAMRGDAGAVRRLVAGGADVNAPQGDGMTALHWAARNDDPELAGFLLESGARVGRTTRIGAYTPLHMASSVGSAGVVALLLEAGSDARAATSREVGGATALHYAASSGDGRVVRALIAAGAAVDARETAWGQTPLIFAASKGRTDAVRALLESGADPAATTDVADIAARAARFQSDRRARNQRLRDGGAPTVDRSAEPDRAAAAGEREGEEPPRSASGDGSRDGARAAADEEYERPIEEPEPLSYGQLIGAHGGMTALLHAAREGHAETAGALLDGGAEVNQPSGSDHTTPMLIAMINGHFDLAMELFDRGADPTLASDAGTTPLYAAINAHWAPKSRYPRQHAFEQQELGYLEVMERLLEAGVDPDVRLKKHLWWVSFNFDLLQIDTKGATPFWRAAYSLDVDAMRLLVSYGADPHIPTEKVPPRRRPAWDAETRDLSGLPPVPVGGPADFPIHAATGVGYGQGFPSNAHRHVPDGWLPAARYLVEELGADVNQRDDEGYTPLHNAASRGDLEVIRFLVEHGADVTAVSRVGQTTADMANGPYQRTQPFPEAVALLESLGSKNNHDCVSC
ncbi:MAG: ankyrin repeat domain-containing protein [Gemmatimonadetes bacterium]|nr:ankyrin repeat domain-containing protein [Gemmatimonadota bacterium]